MEELLFSQGASSDEEQGSPGAALAPAAVGAAAAATASAASEDDRFSRLGSSPLSPRGPWPGKQHSAKAPELSQGNFSRSGRFSVERDVILGAEFIKDSETRLLIAAQRLSLLLGLGLLAWLVWARHSQPASWWLQSHAVSWVNVGTGTLCLMCLLPCCALYLVRARRAVRQRRRWSGRRWHMALTTATELGVQTMSMSLWVGLNAWAVSQGCPGRAWGRVAASLMFVVWTCWNVVFLVLLVQASSLIPAGVLAHAARWLPSSVLEKAGIQREDPEDDTLVLDLPWWFHAPALGIWGATEGLLLAWFLQALHEIGGSSTVASQRQSCDQRFDCQASRAHLGITTAVYAAFLAQLVIFYSLLALAFRAFQHRPYAPFRVPNVMLRFMFQARLLASIFFFLCIVLLWFAQLGSCAAFAEAWLGYAPMQLAGTVVVVVNAEVYLPRTPLRNQGGLLVWLQDFAWREADLPRKLAARQARPEEPMFCFETAIKLLYWSAIVYYTADRDMGGHSVQTALGLLGLTNYEVISERRRDSKCVVAWGGRTILVAFRGTASMANVRSDIKVWRVVHPPPRGSYLLGTRPMVHSGFWHSYAGGFLRGRMLAKLAAIMGAGSRGRKPRSGLGSGGGCSGDPGGGAAGGDCGEGCEADPPWRIYLTGHSLGGALATLAAADVAMTFCPRYCREGAQLSPFACTLACYTFGAPRTGNRAFRNAYLRCVPNTWQVINDQDAVAKAGKFLFLFKHCGHRVIINPQGDLVVRPSSLEASVHRTYRASVGQHLLTSYQASIKAVMKAQFARKGSPAGRRALRQLSRCEYVQDMLVGTLGMQRPSLSLLVPSTPPGGEPQQPQQAFGWEAQAAVPAVATAAAAAAAEGEAEEKAQQRLSEWVPSPPGDIDVVSGAPLGPPAPAPLSPAALPLRLLRESLQVGRRLPALVQRWSQPLPERPWGRELNQLQRSVAGGAAVLSREP